MSFFTQFFFEREFNYQCAGAIFFTTILRNIEIVMTIKDISRKITN